MLPVSLRWTLRVRERSCEWQSCLWSLVYKGLDAGATWGAERTVAAGAGAA